MDIQNLIRLEAYCIYKTREKFGIPGDKNFDWQEAKRKIENRIIEDIISKEVLMELGSPYGQFAT